MDSDRVQHGADVHGTVLGFRGRAIGREESAAGVSARFLSGYDLDAFITEPPSAACAADNCLAIVRYLLPADDDLCDAPTALALHHLRHRRLFNGHPICDQPRGAAGRVVNRASIVALDFLDFSAAGNADDAVHLPSDTAPAGANRPKADDQLGWFLVCQYWAQLDLWRARPGRAIGLVGIGCDRRDARKRRIPDHRRSHSSVDVTQPAD